MTIGKKATLGFGAILLVNLMLGGGSLSVIRSLGNDLDKSVNSTGKAVEQIGRLTTALSDMKAAEAEFILFSSLNDTAKVQAAQADFQDGSGRMEAAMREVRPTLQTSTSTGALENLQRGHAALNGHFQQMVQLCAAQKCNEALTIHGQQALPLTDEMSRTAAQLTEEQRLRLAEAAHGASAKWSQSLWITLILIAAAATIGIAVFLVLQSINSKLRQFATRMAENATQITSAANAVSGSSAELAEGAFKQASSLEETSATTEELAIMTKKNAENARSAFELALQGEQRVGEANRTLQQMETSMSDINGSSNKISKIIKVIEEIAFQTNILALNAAVEAARAGEAGLGFAVVAEEVRSLAQRCSQAARDTASLIEESISRTNEGSTNLGEVARAISGITEASDRIRTLVDEVNMASQEQAKGIEHVSSAVMQMSQVTQRSAGNSEKGAAAGKQMASQAEMMNEIVYELRALVGTDR
jgi:methyl-accepting chemotaxis protein/methyl-accepting chemotaxis protein-1 (serine sensor receptor)